MGRSSHSEDGGRGVITSLRIAKVLHSNSLSGWSQRKSKKKSFVESSVIWQILATKQNVQMGEKNF